MAMPNVQQGKKHNLDSQWISDFVFADFELWVVIARGMLMVGLWAPQRQKTVSTRFLLVSQSVSKGLQRFPMKCCVYFQQDLVSIVENDCSELCSDIRDIAPITVPQGTIQFSSAVRVGFCGWRFFCVIFFLWKILMSENTSHVCKWNALSRDTIHFTPSFAVWELFECHNLSSF